MLAGSLPGTAQEFMLLAAGGTQLGHSLEEKREKIRVFSNADISYATPLGFRDRGQFLPEVNVTATGTTQHEVGHRFQETVGPQRTSKRVWIRPSSSESWCLDRRETVRPENMSDCDFKVSSFLGISSLIFAIFEFLLYFFSNICILAIILSTLYE